MDTLKLTDCIIFIRMERASELTRNMIFSSVSKSIAVKSGKARLECEYLLPDTSYREKRRFWRMRRKHGELSGIQ